MGGVFGVVSQSDCVADVFFGTDYHSHLGTKNGGMCLLGEQKVLLEADLEMICRTSEEISASEPFPTEIRSPLQ